MGSKKYLVLGAGVGEAIAHRLSKNPDTRLVVIGDKDTERAGKVTRFVNEFSHSNCIPMLFDADENQNLVELFKQFDVVISALPAKYNLELAEAAILSNVHFCDLGGIHDLAPILSNGEIKFVKPFYDYSQTYVPELQSFSDLFNGRIETFVTAGASLAAYSFRNWGVKYFAEKTVRWPGFVDFFRTVPLHKFELAVEEFLNIPVDAENPDLVWMRVIAKKGDQQKSISLLDLYDKETGLTAMQRTTGFTTAIIAEMIVERKTKPGVNTPENTFERLDADEVLERVGSLLAFK